MLSVLIPLYNAERYIADTIERCLQQTYKDIELVIVDDHSTDSSLNIAKKYECDNVHVFENPKKGGNAARNYAFLMSKGEYVKFLDADDYCSPMMFEKQMKRILEDGSYCTVAFSPVRMYYENGEWFIPPRDIDHDYAPGVELLLDMWRGKGWNCPHCHLMHRNLVEKAGLWDEQVIKNQDGEFFARVYAAADKALSVPDEYAVWRQFESGVHAVKSIEAIKSALYTKLSIGKLLLNYQDTTEVREILGRSIGYFVYDNWPLLKLLKYDVDYICNQLGVKMMLPERKILKVLKAVCGWQTALTIIKKANL